MCQRQRLVLWHRKATAIEPCVLRDNLLTYWRLYFGDRSLLASTLSVHCRTDGEARGPARYSPTSDGRSRVYFRRDRVSNAI